MPIYSNSHLQIVEQIIDGVANKLLIFSNLMGF
jgi:hypothetical protein